MPPATRKVTRTAITHPEKSAPRASRGFRQKVIEFLSNKAMAEMLTARNQGTGRGDAKTPGLRDVLLAEVIARGEVDPETGSRILELDEPITQDITGAVIRKLKAERRAPKSLDVDTVLKLADKLDVRDLVEEYQYVLRLTASQAEDFAKLLEKAKLVDRVVSTDAVVIEENLLQIHYGRNPHTAGPLLTDGKDDDGNKVKVPLIDEDTLDSLYTVDETWAFKPLTS